MKALFACIVILSLASCQNFTPRQKEVTTAIVGRTLDIIQFAADVFVRVIVVRADSPARASSDADWLDSVAGGLRSIQSTTGGLVTAADVGVAVRDFTDPSKVHWSELAEQLAATFDRSSLPQNDTLEAMATAANAQAATLRAVQ